MTFAELASKRFEEWRDDVGGNSSTLEQNAWQDGFQEGWKAALPQMTEAARQIAENRNIEISADEFQEWVLEILTDTLGEK